MQLSDKQLEFVHKANHRWNFKGGATRSGKTYLDCKWIIPLRIRDRIDQDGLVLLLGVTKSTIERNVLEPMRVIYGNDLVGSISNENKVLLFGQICYALGAEKVSQVSKLRGASVKYCYGDEVADWSPEVFQLLKSRLDKEYSCFDGTYNPQYPEHWLKQFLDSKADVYALTFTLDDNPFVPESFKNNLKREYAGTVFYNRYILGEWTLAEGLIYPMFKRAFHVVVTEPRDYERYYVSMDYGIQNATAMSLWGLSCGVWYEVNEYYHSGREEKDQKTDVQYYEALETLVGDLKIERLIIDPSASSFIVLVKQKKRFKVQKAKNEVLAGIADVAIALQRGNLKFNDCCEKSIKEFGLYAWDSKASEDRPIKQNDHFCDEMRYFVHTVRINDKPGEKMSLWG